MKKTTYGFVFDRKKTATNKVAATLQIRFTKDGKSLYSNTGIKLTKGQWIKKYDFVRNHPNEKAINDRIAKIKGNLDAYILDNPYCTKEVLKGHFEDIGQNLLDFIQKEESKRKLKKGSANNTKSLIHHLKGFGEIPSIKEVDKSFVLRFTDHLHAVRNHYTGQPLKKSTVRNVLSRLKFFTDKAVGQDKIEKNPFRASEPIIVKKAHKEKAYALSNEELKLFEEMTFEEERQQLEEMKAGIAKRNFQKRIDQFQYSKDIFLFSCYTFLPFSDLLDLDIKKHVHYTPKGIKVEKNRVKVDFKKFILPLYSDKMPTGKKALPILLSYMGERKTGKVFQGMPTYFQYRRALIYISNKLGFKEVLKTHSGRQTAIKWYKENTTLSDLIIGLMSCQTEKMVAEYAGNDESRLLNALENL